MKKLVSTVLGTLIICSTHYTFAGEGGNGSSGNGRAGLSVPISVDTTLSSTQLITVARNCTAEIVKQVLQQKLGCTNFSPLQMGDASITANRRYGGVVSAYSSLECSDGAHGRAYLYKVPVVLGNQSYLNGRLESISTPAHQNFAGALREGAVFNSINIQQGAANAKFELPRGEAFPTLLGEMRISRHSVDGVIGTFGNRNITEQYDETFGSVVNLRLQLTSPLSDQVELRNRNCQDPRASETGSCSIYISTRSFAQCVSAGITELAGAN